MISDGVAPRLALNVFCSERTVTPMTSAISPIARSLRSRLLSRKWYARRYLAGRRALMSSATWGACPCGLLRARSHAPLRAQWTAVIA
ncbi:hypothetical protein DM45_3896 [Burkholderia mallei]|nr:hypothetical protein DM45_3896 [Burkholderia mallei]